MAIMDWGKETPQGTEVLPEGTYKVRIQDYKKVTAGTGTPQIRWHVRVVEPEEFRNKPLIDHTAITDKSLWKLAWLVSSCGIAVDKLSKMETNSPLFYKVLDACKGRTSYWHLNVGITPSGKERNEVVDYQKDIEQEIIEVVESDEPEFLKE